MRNCIGGDHKLLFLSLKSLFAGRTYLKDEVDSDVHVLGGEISSVTAIEGSKVECKFELRDVRSGQI